MRWDSHTSETALKGIGKCPIRPEVENGWQTQPAEISARTPAASVALKRVSENNMSVMYIGTSERVQTCHRGWIRNYDRTEAGGETH